MSPRGETGAAGVVAARRTPLPARGQLARTATITIAVALLAAACGVFGGDSDDDDADADAADDAGQLPDAPSVDATAAPDGTTSPDAAAEAGSDADAAASPCPTGVGPEMVRVDVLDRPFCIDRTEVTETQYATFRARLDAAGLAALAPRLPSPCGDVALVALSPGTAPSNLPRANVGFCSAAAFCAAQGKRLCGGLDGGAVVLDGRGAPEVPLEWEVACAKSRDTSGYPWGDIPEPSAAAGCQTQDLSDGGRRAAGTAAACGYTGGPLDMIGNVWEYVNVRRDVELDAYTGVRGGSYTGRTVGNGCATSHGIESGKRGSYTTRTVDEIGFRCCADAAR